MTRGPSRDYPTPVGTPVRAHTPGKVILPSYTTREEIIDAAVEAASAAVWNTVHAAREGAWPDGCDDPDLWRSEEREALLPALDVLERAGALTWPEKPLPEGYGSEEWWQAWREGRLINGEIPPSTP